MEYFVIRLYEMLILISIALVFIGHKASWDHPWVHLWESILGIMWHILTSSQGYLTLFCGNTARAFNPEDLLTAHF